MIIATGETRGTRPQTPRVPEGCDESHRRQRRSVEGIAGLQTRAPADRASSVGWETRCTADVHVRILPARSKQRGFPATCEARSLLPALWSPMWVISACAINRALPRSGTLGRL